MNVFVCHVPGSEQRAEWLQNVNSAWIMVSGVSAVKTFYSSEPATFQIDRRKWAEQSHEGQFYILADDDCLPLIASVDEALRILEAHPEFSILSLLPDNANIVDWTPEGYQTANDAEVMEHVSVGGVRFCRKMPFSAWPAMPDNGYRGYDAIHCQAIRDAGFRVGYFRNLKMHHLGEGHTTLLEAAAA